MSLHKPGSSSGMSSGMINSSTGGMGLRTSPTVKPLAHMNQRSLRTWQITLGPVATVASLGIVLGSIACAFYLGFFSGQKVGIETALNNNLSSAIRLPVDLEELSGESARYDDRYDEHGYLDPQTFAGKGAAGQSPEGATRAKPIPELGSIKSTASSPISDVLPPISDSEVKESDRNSNDDFVSPQRNRAEGQIVLGGSKNADTKLGSPDRLSGDSQGSTTLGALVRESGSSDTVISKQKESPPDTISSIGDVKKVTRADPVPETKPVQSVEAPSPKVEVGAPRSGWFAQIIAPNKLSEAEGVAGKLRASGFGVSIEKANVRGQQYYRVLVGPEDNRKQAELLISQLKRESYIKTEPFLRRIK